MFRGKKILLATMHQKELAIKPPMEKALGCEIIVSQNFDTDQFGTFCGEKQRFLSPKEMVIHKAKVAMSQYSFPFGLASEGTFGPHPLIPFTPFQEELLGFVDLENHIEIVVKKQTTKTNYAMMEFKSGEPIDSFLSTYHFPSHAMIVREMTSEQVIAKGIQTFDELEAALNKAFTLSQTIRLETDMRAMFNPTRMATIKELTFDLINRLQTVCSKCRTYGFGETHVTGNLPCSFCKTETQLYTNVIEKCVNCDHYITKPRADNLLYADPTYCNYCNP